MSSELLMPHISGFISVGACFILATTYVASLYVWNLEQSRDHPSTIKKRFCSVFIVMLISPFLVYFASSKEIFETRTIWELIGIRFDDSFLSALVLPLLLTIVLFIGPLSLQIYNGAWRLYIDPAYWMHSVTNVLWLRNHIVAPLSEEFTFRACMIPLLVQSFSRTTVIFTQPLFFGVAHFHHLVEKLKSGMDKQTAIVTSCFQFTYTTIFGMYSAYLFCRTGHFVAPFIAHAFCNHMGFPDIQELFNQDEKRRNTFISLYIVGLVSWIILLPIVTNPNWYANSLYWPHL